VRGYHPLLAALSETGEVVHARLRGGPAPAAQGAARFISETVSRVRSAGHVGELTLRADAGFYAEKVVKACRTRKVRFSITVPLHRSLASRIAGLPEEAWQPIGYVFPGAAVAEIPYTLFEGKESFRLIVRRVPPSPGSQLALFAAYSYHAFLTDREGDTLALEADHRRHAEIENVIRDLKYGVGLNHLPSGKFGANAGWLALQVLAHNLGRWVGRWAGAPRTTTKTLRTRFLSLPGRITRSARRSLLALPAGSGRGRRSSAGCFLLFAPCRHPCQSRPKPTKDIRGTRAGFGLPRTLAEDPSPALKQHKEAVPQRLLRQWEAISPCVSPGVVSQGFSEEGRWIPA